MRLVPAAQPADGQDQQVDADGGQEHPGHHLGRRDDQLGCGQRAEGQHGAEQQHARRVRERHDGAQLQGLAAGTALPDQVGGHHGLAVTGSQCVQDSEQQRGQHRGDCEGDGQVGAGQEVGEGPRHAVQTAGRDLARRRQVVAHVAAGASCRDAEARGGHVQRRGQQVRRVGQQQVADAGLGHGGAPQRPAGRCRRDLPPAVALGGRRVGEVDVACDGARTAQQALQSGGGQPCGARAADGPGRHDGQGSWAPVDGQLQVVRHRGARGHGVAVELGLGQRAVPVPVEAPTGLRQLTGRDLGGVDDVQHVEPVRGDLEPVSSVDGEVAERVRRGRERRSERQRRRAQQDDEAAASHLTCASRAAARGPCSGEKPGLSVATRVSAALAVTRSPAASAIAPRW